MKTLLSILFITLAVGLKAQSCVTVFSGSFSGSTTEGSLDTYGTNADVHISTLGENKIKISDFSAGFFTEFQQPVDTLVLQLQCDGSLDSLSFTTSIGNAKITSGQYDTLNNQLTIYWEIPYNNLDEKSVFTKN